MFNVEKKPESCYSKGAYKALDIKKKTWYNEDDQFSYVVNIIILFLLVYIVNPTTLLMQVKSILWFCKHNYNILGSTFSNTAFCLNCKF